MILGLRFNTFCLWPFLLRNKFPSAARALHVERASKPSCLNNLLPYRLCPRYESPGSVPTLTDFGLAYSVGFALCLNGHHSAVLTIMTIGDAVRSPALGNTHTSAQLGGDEKRQGHENRVRLLREHMGSRFSHSDLLLVARGDIECFIAAVSVCYVTTSPMMLLLKSWLSLLAGVATHWRSSGRSRWSQPAGVHPIRTADFRDGGREKRRRRRRQQQHGRERERQSSERYLRAFTQPTRVLVPPGLRWVLSGTGLLPLPLLLLLLLPNPLSPLSVIKHCERKEWAQWPGYTYYDR